MLPSKAEDRGPKTTFPYDESSLLRSMTNLYHALISSLLFGFLSSFEVKIWAPFFAIEWIFFSLYSKSVHLLQTRRAIQQSYKALY